MPAELQPGRLMTHAEYAREMMAAQQAITAPHWPLYVRKRLLVQKLSTSLEASEVTVLELSPSGAWVKFAWGPEAESWENATDYRVLEELPPIIDRAKLERGSNVVASCWWKRDDYTFRRIILDPRRDSNLIGSPVEQVMSEWDGDSRGLLFGLNSDQQPLSDAVKGIGPHNRADFERQVGAWFAVHSQEAKA